MFLDDASPFFLSDDFLTTPSVGLGVMDTGVGAAGAVVDCCAVSGLGVLGEEEEEGGQTRREWNVRNEPKILLNFGKYWYNARCLENR